MGSTHPRTGSTKVTDLREERVVGGWGWSEGKKERGRWKKEKKERGGKEEEEKEGGDGGGPSSSSLYYSNGLTATCVVVPHLTSAY